MTYSLQKGRNFSKENLAQKKYTGTRLSEKGNLLSMFSSNGVLQERSNNRLLMRRQSDELLNKKSIINSPLKLPGSISTFDQRYNNLNKKIKDILQSDENQNRGTSLIKTLSQQQKQNTKQNINTNNSQTSNQNFGKGSGSIMRQSSVIGVMRQSLILNQKNQKKTSKSLYFIECLTRKNSVTTQFYINIHTSILTFKQFFKLAQLAKPRLVDTTISPEPKDKKTLVFDMDQTLIHTSQVMTPGYQIKVPFKAFQGKISNGYVNVRPYAKDLLKKLSKHFQIIVFTAGNKCYADPILDHIDPTGVISHRLYRESCTFVGNQIFVKDLRILGRKLENLVLIDNAPHSYMMQLSNGIPILNYFKGKDDNQLFHLQQYLMSLLQVEDVRKVNSQYFRLHQYMKYDSHQKLINVLYNKLL